VFSLCKPPICLSPCPPYLRGEIALRRSLLSVVIYVTSLACAIGCANECAAEARKPKTNLNLPAKLGRRSPRSPRANQHLYSLPITPTRPETWSPVRLRATSGALPPTIACRSSHNQTRPVLRPLLPMRSSGSLPRQVRHKRSYRQRDVRPGAW